MDLSPLRIGRLPGFQSLRGRYLLVASLIALLVVVTATAANLYLKDVAAQNARALQSRDQAHRANEAIRNAIWSAEFSLHTLLISPRPGQQDDIVRHLDEAAAQVDQLANEPWLTQAGAEPYIQALRESLTSLRGEILELTALRRDPNRLYPALPFINGTMLAANEAFDTAAALALDEIAGESGEPCDPLLYRRFDEVRDLWREMILIFRGMMIRFAGFQDIPQDTSVQEESIEILHHAIQGKLTELAALGERRPFGLQTQASLDTMQANAQIWYAGFQKIKELHLSGYWRTDTAFVSTRIQPALENIFEQLDEFGQVIDVWSAHNVAALERAAAQINTGLWALAALTLLFVAVGYALFQRTVLEPVARVAGALRAEAKGADGIELPTDVPREIHHLVEAFEEMRNQVRQRQMALEFQAMHDALTRLPNRSLLQDRLQQAIYAARREPRSHALLIMDLDRFKEINDTLGHQVGDQVLKQVALRLVHVLRQSDTVARLGGDEFAVLLPGADESRARHVAEKILAALEQVFEVGEHSLYVGASIGIALYPQHGEDDHTLIRRADVAMYVAKRNGHGIAFYNETQDHHSAGKLALVGDLRKAIDEDALELHYQPILSIPAGTPVAVEALLRWHHPRQGSIPPNQVIPLAEQTGLIKPLTLWVLNTALRQWAAWHAAGIRVNLAINLSVWNVQDPGLTDKIEGRLSACGVPPEKLVLEITESAMMADPQRAMEVLCRLRALGVHLAVDDFGSGFSSLAYLKRLPVSELKIDKTFVMDMTKDENDAVIVRSTIDLAHNLGLQVVAEGVEDRETWDILEILGCDLAQGYYISHPLPAERLEPWLRARLTTEA